MKFRIFIALFLTACASEQTQPTIIGGTASNDPSVAFMGCTGVVVSPRAVLTAAHCVDYTKPLTRQISITALGSKPIRIKTMVTSHPSFRGKTDYDVAIGFSDVDINVPPRRLSTAVLWENHTIVGYGCNVKGGPTGTQRKGTTKITAYYESILSLTGIGHAPCSGDSGGPVIQKDGKVIGVISKTDWKRTTRIARVDRAQIKDFIKREADKRGIPICGIHANGCSPTLVAK